MCDDLVKDLRYLAKVYSICENENTQEYKLAVKAADAIEELSMKLHGDEAAIAGMKREIERMVVASKPHWIPVTERLPEDAHLVLIRHYSAVGNRFYGLDVYNGSRWVISENVTHWMPLPEPPKEETC